MWQENTSSPTPQDGLGTPSDVYALDLVEGDLLGQFVVELRRPRRGVTRDPRRFLQIAPVPQVLRDPRPPEAVRAGLRGQPRTARTALDHCERPMPRQTLLDQRIAQTRPRAPEQGPTAILGDRRCVCWGYGLAGGAGERRPRARTADRPGHNSSRSCGTRRCALAFFVYRGSPRAVERTCVATSWRPTGC